MASISVHLSQCLIEGPAPVTAWCHCTDSREERSLRCVGVPGCNAIPMLTPQSQHVLHRFKGTVPNKPALTSDASYKFRGP